MTITRRRFLATTAAVPLFGGLARPALAELDLGGARLQTVSDGNLVLPGDFLFEPMPKDALAPVLEEYGIGRDRLVPECNLALYRDGTNTVLFDVGSGPDFMPSAGKIESSLALLDLTPEDITHVVFTHAHPDHLWGLLDDFDEPLFANASFHMGRAEWDYWWNPETVDEIGEARAAFAVGARRRMEVIEEQINRFDDAEEVLPGILAVASPGHTPGHMSFEVGGTGQRAMVIGDAIGNHHVSFAHPEWPSGADQDQDRAIASRLALFDRITSDQLPILGFHLPQGGLGRVEAADQGYRFVPDAS